jgi:hypothetical protein
MNSATRLGRTEEHRAAQGSTEEEHASFRCYGVPGGTRLYGDGAGLGLASPGTKS